MRINRQAMTVTVKIPEAGAITSVNAALVRAKKKIRKEMQLSARRTLCFVLIGKGEKTATYEYYLDDVQGENQ